MAECPDCKRPVISVTVGDGLTAETLLMEPTLQVYVSMSDRGGAFPQDGDRVFHSTGVVQHALVCPAVWRQRLARSPQVSKRENQRYDN